MIKTIEKLCLECNTHLRYGRKDRKFCSQECRSSYHNKNNAIRNKDKKIHDNIMKKNYKIISSFYKGENIIIQKSSFDELGFQFNYFTTVYRSNKNIYYFIYDIGFTPIVKNNIQKLLIVNYKNYMRKYCFNPWKNIEE